MLISAIGQLRSEIEKINSQYSYVRTVWNDRALQKIEGACNSMISSAKSFHSDSYNEAMIIRQNEDRLYSLMSKY